MKASNVIPMFPPPAPKTRRPNTMAYVDKVLSRLSRKKSNKPATFFHGEQWMETLAAINAVPIEAIRDGRPRKMEDGRVFIQFHSHAVVLELDGTYRIVKTQVRL